MSAKEMFEKLGYKEQADSEHIFYINDNYIFRCQIAFDLAEKTFDVHIGYAANDITMKELQAINKKCKELGWI